MRRKKDYRLNYTRVGSMSERERAGKRKLRIWLTAGVAILAIAAVIVGVFLWSRRRQETAKNFRKYFWRCQHRHQAIRSHWRKAERLGSS